MFSPHVKYTAYLWCFCSNFCCSHSVVSFSLMRRGLNSTAQLVPQPAGERECQKIEWSHLSFFFFPFHLVTASKKNFLSSLPAPPTLSRWCRPSHFQTSVPPLTSLQVEKKKLFLSSSPFSFHSGVEGKKARTNLKAELPGLGIGKLKRPKPGPTVREPKLKKNTSLNKFGKGAY